MANKKGKKKVIEKTDNTRDKQRKEHNKILKNIFIGIGILVFLIIILIFISNSLSKFNYKGIDFEIVKFCDAGPPCLVTYRTILPVRVLGNQTVVISSWEDKDTDYNFYFRNDPRRLDVEFNGSVRFASNMVFNSESDFFCDGKGAIAGANFNQLYTILNTKVITDKTAMCDPLDRYVLVNVKPGNETKIEQVGDSCYNIYIKDCEVLEGTEKFMFETLIKVNEELNK